MIEYKANYGNFFVSDDGVKVYMLSDKPILDKFNLEDHNIEDIEATINENGVLDICCTLRDGGKRVHTTQSHSTKYCISK